MEYRIDKDKLKNELTIDQIATLIEEFGGDPKMKEGYFISRTICHNPKGEGSHKLYYYDDSKSFHCFTECSPENFDIYELVAKVFRKEGKECSFYQSVRYVANFFGMEEDEVDFVDSKDELQDWTIINKYDKNNNKEIEKQRVELNFYDESILNHLPQPHITPWEQEGISYEVIKNRNIRYDPILHGVVIPHYNMEGKLIGIRERTLIKEEEQYGKYKPAILNGQMYNHPLSFALYNLNNSKENIKLMKKALVFESEKATMLYASLFGMENDISVAVCGSSLISYQVKLLLSLGVQEIIIAFDRDFDKIGDEVWKRQIAKYYNIHDKYSKSCTISFMFDKQNLLGKKCSPIDCGKEAFLKLFEERVIL